MYGYFYLDFTRRYPNNSFVFTEAEYAKVLTDHATINHLLRLLDEDFRKHYKKSGRLRPDIMGVSSPPVSPDRLPSVRVELAEVSTYQQAASTLQEDVKYKLEKLKEIVEARLEQIGSTSGRTYTDPVALAAMVHVAASSWRPKPAECIVPLPPRVQGPVTYVEWICFAPTFRVNPPHGIDGLLLYEVHSIPLNSARIPVQVVEKLRDEERRRRMQAKIADGLLLREWLNESYLHDNPTDAQALRWLARALGIGFVAFVGWELLPVVGPAAVDFLTTTAAGAEMTSAALTRAAMGLSATVETAGQWIGAVGRPIRWGQQLGGSAYLMP